LIGGPHGLICLSFYTTLSRQVVGVAAGSDAAASKRPWPMKREKMHDKIVQLHQKEASREENAKGKEF